MTKIKNNFAEKMLDELADKIFQDEKDELKKYSDYQLVLVMLIRLLGKIKQWKSSLYKKDFRKAHYQIKEIEMIYSFLKGFQTILPNNLQCEINDILDYEFIDAKRFEKEFYVEHNFKISRLRKITTIFL